jgi:hypothetical protein
VYHVRVRSHRPGSCGLSTRGGIAPRALRAFLKHCPALCTQVPPEICRGLLPEHPTGRLLLRVGLCKPCSAHLSLPGRQTSRDLPSEYAKRYLQRWHLDQGRFSQVVRKLQQSHSSPSLPITIPCSPQLYTTVRPIHSLYMEVPVTDGSVKPYGVWLEEFFTHLIIEIENELLVGLGGIRFQ